MRKATQKALMILGDISPIIHRGIYAGGGVGFALASCYLAFVFVQVTDPWLAPEVVLPRDQEILLLGSVTLLLAGYLLITGLVLEMKGRRRAARAY